MLELNPPLPCGYTHVDYLNRRSVDEVKPRRRRLGPERTIWKWSDTRKRRKGMALEMLKFRVPAQGWCPRGMIMEPSQIQWENLTFFPYLLTSAILPRT